MIGELKTFELNGNLLDKKVFDKVQYVKLDGQYLKDDWKGSYIVKDIKIGSLLYVAVSDYRKNMGFKVVELSDNKIVARQIPSVWIKTLLKEEVPFDNYSVHFELTEYLSNLSDEELLEKKQRKTYPSLRKLDYKEQIEVLKENPFCFSSRYYFNLNYMDNSQVDRIDALINNIDNKKTENKIASFNVDKDLLEECLTEYNKRNDEHIAYLRMEKYYDAGWFETKTYYSHSVYPKELHYNTSNKEVWIAYLLEKFNSKSKEDFFNTIESFWSEDFNDYQESSKRYVNDEKKSWSLAVICKKKNSLSDNEKFNCMFYYDNRLFNKETSTIFYLKGVNEIE